MKEKNPLHVEVGQRIRARREDLKWSRDQLSEAADISTRFLACVENGQSGLSMESLKHVPCAGSFHGLSAVRQRRRPHSAGSCGCAL